MSDLKSKIVCVVDHGPFCELARTLAKSFGKTYLFVPWACAFPQSTIKNIGYGLEGVEKIDTLEPHIDEIDLFVFPDIYFGSLQEDLVKRGKLVWGSRMAEEMELYRVFMKNILSQIGLAVGPYELVRGIDMLRDYLKAHENVYIKISCTRGDFETFKSINYHTIESKIDELEMYYGPMAQDIDFIVERPLEPAIEIGYDGYCIDGKYPNASMFGIEIKDRGYVGMFREYSRLPKQLLEANKKLSPILADYSYRGFMSTEVRVTQDGVGYMIDPCMRAGSPPSETYMLMYENLAEIMWEGAQGRVVDPVPRAQWGAQIMMLSEWSNEHWQAIEFPEELRDNVKLHFPYIKEGPAYYTVPHGFDISIAGAVVALGDTLEEAIENVKTVAAQVKGYDLEIDVNCLDEAESEFQRLVEQGIL